LFDQDALMELTDGDHELLQDLVETFLEGVPEHLRQIEEGLAAGDLEAVHRAAHALKGAVANFSAPGAFEAARALDDAARAGRAGELAPRFEELVAQLDKLGPALRSFAESR